MSNIKTQVLGAVLTSASLFSGSGHRIRNKARDHVLYQSLESHWHAAAFLPLQLQDSPPCPLWLSLWSRRWLWDAGVFLPFPVPYRFLCILPEQLLQSSA